MNISGKSIKKNCSHPGEDFSLHPHFRKQKYLFFGLIEYLQSKLTVLLGICIISKNSDAHSRLLIFLPMNLSNGFPIRSRLVGDILDKMTKKCIKIPKSKFLCQNSEGTWGRDRPIFGVVGEIPLWLLVRVIQKSPPLNFRNSDKTHAFPKKKTPGFCSHPYRVKKL